MNLLIFVFAAATLIGLYIFILIINFFVKFLNITLSIKKHLHMGKIWD